MNRAVLDASALLAYLQGERGFEKVKAVIANGAYLSTVNLVEVLSKLADRGQDAKVAFQTLTSEGLLASAIELVPFLSEDSVAASQLRNKTKTFGLSLADRACLALALRLKLPALTADRSWQQLKLGVTIDVIR